MEILHFFYLGSLLINWLDRTLFQARPESFSQLRDLMVDSAGTLDREPVLVGPIRRPFAVGFNMVLAFPIAWFTALAIALGPIDFLARPMCGPGPVLEMIEAISLAIVLIGIWIVATRWLLKWYWFAALEMTREGVSCRMGNKRMFLPWFLLDCLPSEPFIDKASEEPMAAIRPPRGMNAQDSVRYFENEEPRKPWDQALFPIQVGPTGLLLFSNWFAIPHQLLAKMLAALAANQVLCGKGGFPQEFPK